MAESVINGEQRVSGETTSAASGLTHAPSGAWGPPTSPAAGWYPVGPNGDTRYFDGRAWDPNLVAGGSAPGWPTVAPRGPHRTLPLVAGFTIYVILVVGLIVVDVLFATLDSYLNSVALAVAAVVALLLLGEGPAIWWASYVRRRWGDGTWASIGWKWSWSDLGWGVLTWFVGVLVIAMVRAILAALDVPTASNLTVDSPHAPSVAGRVLLVVLLVVVAPLTEELIFRGVMLRSFLSRMHPVAAIALQGLLFGAAHYSPGFGVGNIGLIIVLSSFGCVLGTAAYLCRQIGSTVVAHAIFNGLAALVFLLTL